MSFLFGGGSNITNEADKISEFQATTCEYSAVPLLFGTCKVGTNLVEFSDLESERIKTTVKTGKHSSSTTIDYKYYSKLVLALGEAGDGNMMLGQVWVGGKAYGSLTAMNDSKEEGYGLTYMPAGGTPYTQSYSDLALLYGRVYLGYNSANVPSYNFEVRGLCRNGGTDANPADVIKYMLQLLGMDSYIDATSWEQYKKFCAQMGLLISTPGDYFNDQKSAHEIIEEILTLTNTYMFWSVDSYKFVPLYPQIVGEWHPDTTVQYSLSKNDFEKSSFSFKRKDSSQQYNAIKVQFTNRANNYETESVNYIDVAKVQAEGIKQTTITADWLHTKEAAVKLAKMMAEKYLNEVTEYTFKLGWSFNRLEPGDLVELNDDTLNICAVARISEIQENNKGIITVKAISTPIDNYKVANYTVTNSYTFIDYNVVPGDTEEPIFITPPSELTTASSGVEVWVALRGKTSNWGGCQVYNSWDDEHYAYSGQQLQESLSGKVQSDSDSSMVIKLDNIKQEELLPNQLVWVNGEIIKYTTATLTGANTYRLTGLSRAQHNTTKVIHSANDTFVVLDNALYVVQLLKEHVGDTLYFKFPAFNIFKGQTQELNDLESKSYRVAMYDIPNVTGLTAVASGWSVTSTINAYQINVSWTKPDWADYEAGLVYYKNSTHTSWTYADQGENHATITQAVAGDTYTIAVCTKDIYGNYELPDASTQVTCAVEVNAEVPNAPTNFSIAFTDVITVSWDIVTNSVISRYEVRSGTDHSSSDNLLYSGSSNKATIQLSDRGPKTLYLYAVSVYDKYSSPVNISYSKSVPSAPNQPSLTAKIQGISISMDSIPNDCRAIKLVINDVATTISTNKYYYSCEAGVYSIKYCFVDCFGDGNYSSINTATVLAYIPPELIESESISIEKLNEAAQEAIKNGGLNNVNIAVKGILGEGSALVLQDDGSYALVASNGEKLTGIFANEDGVIRLQGDYIHLTGDTVMDSNCIIKGQMVAGSISCDDGVSINAGKLTINATGMSFKNATNETFTVTGRQMIGTASHGQHVAFSSAWDVTPSVICIPRQWQTQLSTYSNTNLYTECYANNITTTGFDVVCRTFAQAGSYSSINFGAGTQKSGTVNSDKTITVTSSTFTLAGNGDMTASVSGTVTATGSAYYDDSIGITYAIYNRVTQITATLYIGGSAYATKTIWTGTSTGTVNASCSFDAAYTNSKTAYISYNIVYSIYRINAQNASYSAQALGGNATYKLSSNTQVATGDVTFIVTDGSNNAFYTVS